MRSVTKTVQRRRCTRSASAHAHVHALALAWKRSLARHRLAPPKQAGREQERVENGERCTVVMSLPALRPPPFPLEPILDFVARREISGISESSIFPAFPSFQVFQAERRFTLSLPGIDLFIITSTNISPLYPETRLINESIPLHAGSFLLPSSM